MEPNKLMLEKEQIVNIVDMMNWKNQKLNVVVASQFSSNNASAVEPLGLENDQSLIYYTLLLVNANHWMGLCYNAIYNTLTIFDPLIHDSHIIQALNYAYTNYGEDVLIDFEYGQQVDGYTCGYHVINWILKKEKFPTEVLWDPKTDIAEWLNMLHIMSCIY